MPRTDKILVSGTLGDHGIAIAALRENLSFQTSIRSDFPRLHNLVATTPGRRHTRHPCITRPTRGGVATTLNEIAQQSSVGMMIYEDRLPIQEQVQALCEFIGLDPLYIANEGKLIAICAAEDAEKLLHVMHAHPWAGMPASSAKSSKTHTALCKCKPGLVANASLIG